MCAVISDLERPGVPIAGAVLEAMSDRQTSAWNATNPARRTRLRKRAIQFGRLKVNTAFVMGISPLNGTYVLYYMRLRKNQQQFVDLTATMEKKPPSRRRGSTLEFQGNNE